MNLLLVTFSLRNSLKDYDPFFVAMRGNSLQWWHFIEQTAVVVTQYTANQFTQKLLPHMENTDSLLVVQITNEMQGWLPKEAWDWLYTAANAYGVHIIRQTEVPAKLRDAPDPFKLI